MDTVNNDTGNSHFQFTNNIFQKIFDRFYPTTSQVNDNDLSLEFIPKENAKDLPLKSEKEISKLISKVYFNPNIFDYPLQEDTQNLTSSHFENTSKVNLDSFDKINSNEENTMSNKSIASKKGNDCSPENSINNSLQHDYIISVDYNTRETSFRIETDKSASQSDEDSNDFMGAQIRVSSDSINCPQKSLTNNLTKKMKNKSHQKELSDVSTQYENCFTKTHSSQTPNSPFLMNNIKNEIGSSALFPDRIDYNAVSFEGDQPIYLTMSDSNEKNILKIQLSDIMKTNLHKETISNGKNMLSSQNEFNRIVNIGNHMFNIINEHKSMRHFRLTIYDITPKVSLQNVSPFYNTLNNYVTNASSSSSQTSEKPLKQKIDNKYKSLQNTYKSAMNRKISKLLTIGDNEYYYQGIKENGKHTTPQFLILKSGSNEEEVIYDPLIDKIKEELNDECPGAILKKISENYKEIFPPPDTVIYSSITNFDCNQLKVKTNKNDSLKSEQIPKFDSSKDKAQSSEYENSPHFNKYLYKTFT